MEFNLLHLIRLLSQEQINAYIESSEIPQNLPLYLTQQLKDNYAVYRNIFAKLNCEETDLYQRITLNAGKSNSFKLKVRNKLLKRILGCSFELNVCQAAVLDLVNVKSNVLINSPTGTGKTIMALFFILRTLGYEITNENENTASEQPATQENGLKSTFVRVSKTIRIVYLSPLKVLCSQIFSFLAEKLSGFINISIVTSDDSLTHKELVESNLIVTTPEKFDSILKKHVLSVDLLIIDEIHVLNSDRGAVLETMISRMVGKCRILGMSATIPNLKDISVFLKAKAIHFDGSYRSIPLEINLIKVQNHEDVRVARAKHVTQVLNKLLNEQEGNTIVFIRRRAEVEDCYKMFSGNSAFKCLYHHAGLSRSKRLSAENSFLESGGKTVLFSTSTLAWGVNLPADNVIIFDDFTDYDIVQMMGRAGREKYHKPENVARAFLITDNVDRLDLICNLKPIKSQIKDIEDIYLTNLFLRTEQAFEYTLYCLERAGNVARNAQEQITEKNQQRNAEMEIYSADKNDAAHRCSDRKTEPYEQHDGTADAVAVYERVHIHGQTSGIFSCDTPTASKQSTKIEKSMNNNINHSYNKTYHMFYDVIHNLMEQKLIFLHNGTPVLSIVARIAVIFTINYKTALRYFEQMCNFRTEEEIFLILNELQIKGSYTCQDLFPTDTMIGKYIQYCILKHKRINDTIRVILRHLRALLHLSNEKGTVRGSKLLLLLILMIENNVNRRKEDSRSTESEHQGFESAKIDKSIFRNSASSKEYHLFVSDPLDSILICYRRVKTKDLDFLALHGVFLVCFIGNDGSKENKIVRFGPNSSFYWNIGSTTDNKTQKKDRLTESKADKRKKAPCTEQEWTNEQASWCIGAYKRELIIIDNNIADYCSPLMLYQHYLVKLSGKGIVVFADNSAYSLFRKNGVDVQSYRFVDYLQGSNTDEYDWCYIMGTCLRRDGDIQPEHYRLEHLFLINSKEFYILGNGLSAKKCTATDLECLKERFNIANTFSLSMIEVLKEHFIRLRIETADDGASNSNT